MTMFSFWGRLSRRLQWSLMLLAFVVAVGTGAYRKPWQFQSASQRYMANAHTLATFGTLGMTAPATAPAGAAAVPQRQVPPAYPLFLAVLAKLDPRVAAGLACYGLQGERCTMASPFGSVVVVQIAAGIGIMLLVYLLAIELTGRVSIGYQTVFLYWLMGRLGEHARFIQPENLKHLALFASLYLAAVGYRRHSVGLMAGAGALLGMAALFHPQFGYLLVLVPGAMMAIGHWRGARDMPALAPVSSSVPGQAAFAVCGVLVLLPWAARNLALFGDPMLSDHYEAWDLAHRLAYNSMSAFEGLVATLYWIPTNGDLLAKALFGEVTRIQQGGIEAGTYFHSGRSMFLAAVAAAPGNSPMFPLLAEEFSLWRHLATTPVMFTRGMWGSHGFMAMIGLALLPRLVRELLASPQRDAGIALLVTSGLLVLVHALLTPNHYWLNTPMLFVVSLATAHALDDLSKHQPRLVEILIIAGVALLIGVNVLKVIRGQV